MKRGEKYSIYFGHGNPNNEKIEIREIVDDCQVVYRVGRKYRIESLMYFEMIEKYVREGWK